MGCAHDHTAEDPEPGLSLLRLAWFRTLVTGEAAESQNICPTGEQSRKELRVSQVQGPAGGAPRTPGFPPPKAFQTQHLY